MERQDNGKAPAVFAVCGAKNTGKTALVCEIVARLAALGFRVGTIKHAGHGFDADTPGTDSHAHKRAGASASIVYSGARFQLVRDMDAPDPDALCAFLGEVDAVVFEGGKDGGLYKIELLRRGVCETPRCDRETLLCVVADFPFEADGVRTIDRRDMDAIMETVLAFIRFRR